MPKREAPALRNPRLVLRFWRDVEIFNIPTAPKPERKWNKNRELILHTASYRIESPLPWQPNHVYSRLPTKQYDWTHAVFLGVTEAQAWTEVVLQAVGAGRQLEEDDSQRLSGKGWLAAFMVNGQGEIIRDSFVPAGFALGIERLCSGRTLDGLSDNLQDLALDFKERHSITLETDSEDDRMRTGASMDDNGEALGERPRLQADWNELQDELQRALRPLGQLTEKLSLEVIIRSTRRKRHNRQHDAAGESDIDFLNSFYLNDLDRLIEQADQNQSLGRALDCYLGPAVDQHSRCDILRDPQAMQQCLSPTKLTAGRWPGNPEHHLMLAQQAAVGEIVAQLSNSAGLVAVNGPPGTGKTTLLRDVIADVVVQRARALASLDAPQQVFGKKTVVGGLNIYPLQPKIVAGTGIVVASNNNAAVENITKELPALSEISSKEFPGAGYFKEVAAQVFAASGSNMPAWGLVAAALGNSNNRRTFASAFVRDGKPVPFVPGQPCDIRSRLEAQERAGGVEQWEKAKTHFLELLDQVEEFRAQYFEIEQVIEQQTAVRKHRQQLAEEAQALHLELTELSKRWELLIAQTERASANAGTQLAQAERAEQRARLEAQSAVDRLKVATIEKAPRFWHRWLEALGMTTSRMRAWQDTIKDQRLDQITTAERLRDAMVRRDSCAQELAHHEKLLQRHAGKQREASAAMLKRLSQIKRQQQQDAQLEQQCVQELERFRATGGTLPDDIFFEGHTPGERHVASAWVSTTFDCLRSQLFLAALRLHETTLLACNGKAIANLKAVKAMLMRASPEPIAPSQRIMIWDMLFFTVPVVSSSLASFDRLFADLGPESLGWLLIDEAGQATPQSVCGALWRSRRVVIIGDPRQIEPVVTVPAAVIARLREKHGVDVCWSPATESAQTVADRTMTLGAYIGDAHVPETAVWTGLPLRAHRRSIDPMFSFANAIAYAGQMVQTTKPDEISCPLGDSAWLDVSGTSNEGQVVVEEMTVLASLLRLLAADWPTHGKESKKSGVFVISPFRKVADACRSSLHEAGLSRGEWPVSSGTVHTFQGKQAEIVVIVLGSTPGRVGNGSRSWASNKPNLLNVALTRAKLRVYVIGSARDWGRFPQFDVLLDTLRRQGRVLDTSTLFPQHEPVEPDRRDA